MDDHSDAFRLSIVHVDALLSRSAGARQARRRQEEGQEEQGRGPCQSAAGSNFIGFHRISPRKEKKFEPERVEPAKTVSVELLEACVSESEEEAGVWGRLSARFDVIL